MELSAVVIARNEEKNIVRCLRSLRFADEIVVVDALSEDRTVERAKKCGARVIERKWPGYAEQKEFAINQTHGDWVLLCDADEEVPPKLAEEVRSAVKWGSGKNAYTIRRKNQFLGEWVQHGPWAHDDQVRVFKKAHASVTKQSVHEGIEVQGNVGKLKNMLHHYTHQTLDECIERMNKYTTLEANDRKSRRTIRLVDAVVPPMGIFIKYYFLKGCWRGGVRGFLLSATTAMYKSLLYLKIYFLQRRRMASS